MSVSYIGHGLAKAGAASVAVTSHASTLAGDLLVLKVHSGSTVSSISGGSSPTWTQRGTTVSTSNGLTNLQVWTAPAAAGDIGAAFTVNLAASTQVNCALETWRGGASIRVDNFQSSVANTSATNITSPTWNGDASTRVGTAFAGENTTSGTPTCTDTGASWTETGDHANATLIGTDYANDVATSGTGNAGCTFTWTLSSASRAVIVFEITDFTAQGGVFFSVNF